MLRVYKSRATRAGLVAVFCVATSWQPLWAAEDDDYLRALSDEAGRLGASSSAPAEPQYESAPLLRESRPDFLTAGLNFADFRAELKDRFFGTYSFFSKLSENAQHEVYRDYQEDPRVKTVRDMTMKRFLSQ